MRSARLCCLLVVSACAGPAGGGLRYSPTAAESAALLGTSPWTPAANRHGRRVSLAGIVKSRAPGPNGLTELTVSVRRIAEKNRCPGKVPASCLPTVRSREVGIAHLLVRLDTEEDIGAGAIRPGSLVRAVATPRDEVTAGGLALEAEWHRHFPEGAFAVAPDR